VVNYRRPAGLFAGKVIKWLAKKLPWDYKIFGVSVKNLAIGGALIALDQYVVPYAYKGYLEDAGWMIIIDEIAHAIGINPGEKETKVVYVERTGGKKAIYV